MGHRGLPLPPSPLPPRRERGAEGGVRVPFPTAYAMGYDLTPQPGLRNGRVRVTDFNNSVLARLFCQEKV